MGQDLEIPDVIAKRTGITRGLPNAAVWDLQIHPRDNMIVIAANGRGMWVLDDPSPLQK